MWGRAVPGGWGRLSSCGVRSARFPGGGRGGSMGKARIDEGSRMKLRRAGLGLLVGAILMAPAGASAGPALVFEPYNGTVFYAEDPDAQWFPASLTKLMTAYVAFQALKAGTVTPDTKLICSKEATEQAPSKLWLKVGE